MSCRSEFRHETQVPARQTRPGSGTLTTSPNVHDRAVIAAYTVPSDGTYAIQDSTITVPTAAGGVEVCVDHYTYDSKTDPELALLAGCGDSDEPDEASVEVTDEMLLVAGEMPAWNSAVRAAA